MKNKWLVVIILAFAQFIMVLDSTVMNVSISQVVADLDTTVSGLQAAITFYTLTMAALMLTGGKLGDIWGRLRVFKIGSVIYAIGSLITAVSPNLLTLFIGWSVIEGIGAIMVIPAIAALVAYNYKGKDRITAFAIIGAISGVAAAVGPLIGGYITTYFSWRYVFVAETFIMIGVLLFAGYIGAPTRTQQKITLDVKGVMLSSIGMVSLVFGLLQSKTWGWVKPLGKPVIAGNEIAPLGISLTAYLIVIGLMVLWYFYTYQQKLESEHGQPLLSVSMLANKTLKSGLAVICSQYFITAAVFFVIPIYLQTVLGFNALETGAKIFPLSLALILASFLGSRLSSTTSPKRIIRYGQAVLVIGVVLLLSAISPGLAGAGFSVGMFTIGFGLGLLLSQIGNIIMSSVNEEKTSEAGGLQGTFQNLGSSFGTALIGSVLIASLTSGFVASVNASTVLPQNVKTYVAENTKAGISIVPVSQVEEVAASLGLSEEAVIEAGNIYQDAQIEGLRYAVFFIAIFAVFSIIFSRNIPNKIVE